MERREFIKLVGGSAASVYVFAMMGGCETLLQQIKNRPIRRNISTLALNDPTVEAYRTAVTKMKALPSSDPRNWKNQATIHNNHCPHGNWYFLPWHRAYIYYFETIVRELSGYSDFALPYWDWTCSPQVPPHFFGANNPLVDTSRQVSPTDTIPAGVADLPTMTGILNLSDYQSFGSYESTALRGGTGGATGQLEGTPHNVIHDWVGGNMATFMSPLDPVFWCHHGMIERCWWEWNITRGNPNPNTPNWYNLPLNGMFCDKDGNPVDHLTVGLTALMPLFDYQFDDRIFPCAPGVMALPPQKSAEELKTFLQKGGPFRLAVVDRVKTVQLERIVVRLRQEERVKLSGAPRRLLMASELPNRRYVLKVDGATIKEANDVFVRVFINAPAGDTATGIESPYYAGSFAFFGSLEHAQHPGGNTYYIDLTRTLGNLRQKSLLPSEGDLTISFVAVPIHEAAVSRGHVELSGVEVLLGKSKPE